MAEARAAVTRPDVRLHPEGTSTKEAEYELVKSTFLSLKKCAFRTHQQIRNGLWPTTWSNLLGAVIVIAGIIHFDHHYHSSLLEPITTTIWWLGGLIYLDESYNYNFRVIVLSVISGIAFFAIMLYVRQYVLRILLSYRGWMYETPRSQSILTLCWGALVRLFSGHHPTLYSYQNSLPRMPVPSVKDTCQRFLLSMKPLLDDKEYEEFRVLAEDFEKNQAPKLQFILQLKSWWASNYHTDWWEKYVYLMGRSPLPINSNYYGMDQGWYPTRQQPSRAAAFCYFILKYRQELEAETLQPLVIRNTIPTCMWQYERQFKTVRVPKEEIDELVHYETTDQEHLVVNCQGHYYMVPVKDKFGKILSILDFESQFEWILADVKHSEEIKNKPEGCVAALTGLPRTDWARLRENHFGDGLNKQSLETIEEALFMVVLEERSFPDITDRAKFLMHGDGTSFWFDKSFTVMVFSDGKCGLNAEHSWADAPVMGHLLEYGLTYEFIYRTYNDKGQCFPIGGAHRSSKIRTHNLQRPSKLYFDITPPLAESIENASEFGRKNNDDLQHKVITHDTFGKGFIKTVKVSPDAFIQLAIQLAYYKDSNGKHALTYEASMTRLYLQGRTETVRSVTMEVRDFVRAFMDKSVPREEVIKLLKAAGAKHAINYKDCMNGKGCDRHLFALYIVSKGQGLESEFLKRALSLPWTLSTSQQPQQQMVQTHYSVSEPELMNMVSPGGGFGPVTDDGYGVSYMVPDENRIFFHVSSKISSKDTDSDRFVNNLFESMAEMKALFDKGVDDKTSVSSMSKDS